MCNGVAFTLITEKAENIARQTSLFILFNKKITKPKQAAGKLTSYKETRPKQHARDNTQGHKNKKGSDPFKPLPL